MSLVILSELVGLKMGLNCFSKCCALVANEMFIYTFKSTFELRW